ncbi:hypothetical protein [Herbaspirillum sp. SJZ107]|uniref:hypothetical protein n=1 Tax=Herbaspirillum sp. SJZ107 TaxID=2572881 RepID=UPI00114FFD55|nr:hypothetical protein [Herbaspirillum sp. SJZ107]
MWDKKGGASRLFYWLMQVLFIPARALRQAIGIMTNHHHEAQKTSLIDAWTVPISWTGSVSPVKLACHNAW